MYYFCVDIGNMMLEIVLKSMIIVFVVFGAIGFFGVIYYSLRVLFAIGQSILNDFDEYLKK